MNALTTPCALIQLHSGAVVDLAAAEPDLSALTLDDIALSLSRLPRFLGHTRTVLPYSVAQHSCLVMSLLDDPSPELTRAALLHDAHEALMGDIPTPVKNALRGHVTALEAKLQRAVFRRFRVSVNLIGHHAVDWADQQALATERAQLLAPASHAWGQHLPEPTAHDVTPWAASYAQAQFLIHWRQSGAR